MHLTNLLKEQGAADAVALGKHFMVPTPDAKGQAGRLLIPFLELLNNGFEPITLQSQGRRSTPRSQSCKYVKNL